LQIRLRIDHADIGNEMRPDRQRYAAGRIKREKK
jgi:hypothetical protein